MPARNKGNIKWVVKTDSDCTCNRNVNWNSKGYVCPTNISFLRYKTHQYSEKSILQHQELTIKSTRS